MSLTVYGDIYSGKCYKVKLVLCRLGLAHEWQHVDILQGESRTPAFLALNPNGRIPVLVDADRVLCESNAIVHYLASGSALLPTDRFLHAQVLQWQFFEQYSHEPCIATSRYIVRYLGSPPSRQAELDTKRDGGYAALAVMEQHLAHVDYFVGEAPTIADLSLYAYTHVADEGGFSLAGFPRIQAWLERIASAPGHVSMDQFAP
jgi:glutathione S-transferase